MEKMEGKIFLLPLFFILLFLQHAGAANDVLAPEQVSTQISVSWAPEIPVPNATIKFRAICENVSSLKIQFCLNGLCGFPVDMVVLGNNTFEYLFVPGDGGNPYTKDGDNLSFEILLNGEMLYTNWIIIRENAKPIIHNIWFVPEFPKLGNNFTISANVTDDLGVEMVKCNISHESDFWEGVMLPRAENFSTEFTPLYSGQHLITIIAIDNSNQSVLKNTAVFVFPPEQRDNASPVLVDAFGIRKNETNMTVRVYLTDGSGIAEAGIFINQTFYPLERAAQGFFTAEVPLSKTVQIYARDPYNNTLNTSYDLKVYTEASAQPQNPSPSINGMTIAIALLLGILGGIAIILFVKNLRQLHILLLPLLIGAIVLSAHYGLIGNSADAGGNIYHGNTCWSCLALQPKSLAVSWLENYPNGSPVNHPQWVLDALAEGKPLLLYVHQVPCTGCEVQWRDMVSHGIITSDGKISGRFEDRISFKVLDVTMGSETREQGIAVLKTYTLGQALGTPTTVCVVKTGTSVLWWSKAGVVYSDELTMVLDEALHMHRG
ncbi:MAG: hypothetical protein N3F63_03600 [Thermoplasmata archaeon]|nr:hypothetical protein [Thermoplasmata archaeon]